MKLRLSSFSDVINVKNIADLQGIKVSGKSVKIGARNKAQLRLLHLKM